MRSIVRGLITVIGLGISAAAVADHCENAPSVRYFAHELDEATRHFHRVIHRRTGYSHLAQDVHELAEAAEQLHEAAHERASCEEIRYDFQHVRHEFRHVRAMLQRAHDTHHDRHVMQDWQSVVHAFRAVRSVIRGDDGHDDHFVIGDGVIGERPAR